MTSIAWLFRRQQPLSWRQSVYQHHLVIAAYGPIAGTPLGLVVKIRIGDFYAPIRRKLEMLLPALLLFVGLGTLTLRAQIKPLLTQMLVAERTAKRVGEEAEEKERRLRAVVDNVVEGIITIDSQGLIDSLNPAAAAMFGYEPEALTGQDLSILMPEHHRRAHAAGLARVVHTGTATLIGRGAVELQGLRKDGSIMALELSIGAVSVGSRQSFVGIVRDISERKRVEAELLHRAHHDPLTGLPNRALFLDRLAQAIHRSNRSKSLLALACLDIDRFKEINDGLGHGAGDALLREMSARFTKAIRASDTVARLGGDEFMLLFENLAHREDACGLAEKILARARPPFALEGSQVLVTVSVGIAYFRGGSTSAEALMKAADQALYRAKQAGRDRYQEAPLEAS